jgi:hypothetical protein
MHLHPPVHLLRDAELPIGGVSRGATGNTLGRCVASTRQGGHRTGRDQPQGNGTAHQSTLLSSARGEARHEDGHR